MTQKDERVSRRTERHRQQQRAQGRRTILLAALGLVVVGVLALAGFLASGALSGSGAAKQSAAASWSTGAYSGGPRLAVDRTTVDDGAVPYNHEVDATYRLKNVGDQPLNLQKASVEALEGC